MHKRDLRVTAFFSFVDRQSRNPKAVSKISAFVLCIGGRKGDVFMENRKRILALVEGAVMVALAFGLDMLSKLIPFLNLPWGGSITLLSMLPIVVYSIRNGVKSGLMCSFVYSLVQLVVDLPKLGTWGLTPITFTLCALLDYIIAFSVLGLAGLFRNKGMKGWIGGAVCAIFMRYVSHVISGAAVFAAVGKIWNAIEITNPWLYSMAYNACYMLPEMILTTIGAVLLFKTGAVKMILRKQESKA